MAVPDTYMEVCTSLSKGTQHPNPVTKRYLNNYKMLSTINLQVAINTFPYGTYHNATKCTSSRSTSHIVMKCSNSILSMKLSHIKSDPFNFYTMLQLNLQQKTVILKNSRKKIRKLLLL